MTGKRWHRDVWAEAVWCSTLPPLHRLVALVYADHARDKDRAWVPLSRLCERTGLGRTAALAARQALVVAGWLVEVLAATPRSAAHYALVIPEGQGSATRTAGVRETDFPGAQDAPLGCATRTAGVRETDPTSSPTSCLTSTTAATGGGSPEVAREQETNEAADALRAALPQRVTLTAAARASLTACVRRGWTPDALVRAVATPSWQGVTHPPAVLAKRLGECANQQPPRTGSPRPEWCGECDERTRQVGEDRPARCPRCHPTLVAVA